MRICSVNGCDKRHLALGLCVNHYSRRRYACNIKKERKRSALWRNNNHDKFIAISREWRRKNHEKHLESKR